MKTIYRILVLGSSYGLLFGVRAALAGHAIDIVGRADEVEQINASGPCLLVPARGSKEVIEISSRTAQLELTAKTCEQIDVKDYDLVVFAIQEPQFIEPDLADLARRVALSGKPVLSIMNMVLPPYLKRLNGVWNDDLKAAYYCSDLWDQFDPLLVTQSSPDPQAVRIVAGQAAGLKVALPSNIKVAPFHFAAHQEMLQDLARSMRLPTKGVNGDMLKPMVQLVPMGSLYAPLAKWPMLVAGNYRCINDRAPVSIRNTVLDDIDMSQSIYRDVSQLCFQLGATSRDLVSFDAYCIAVEKLIFPSAVARALAKSIGSIERMDLLIMLLFAQQGMANPRVQGIVEVVDKNIANLAA